MTKSSLSDVAREFATVSLASERGTDVALAALAFRAPTTSAKEAAEAFSLARAEAGSEHLSEAFTPSEAFPTWEAFLVDAATRAPFTISEKTVLNLRNAYRFLVDSGIPVDNATALADAKRLVSKNAKSAKALAESTVKPAADPVAALARLAGESAVKVNAAAKVRDARAEEISAAREADPVGFALAALLRRVGIDRDASGGVVTREGTVPSECRSLAALLREAADRSDRAAELAAGGRAVVDAAGVALAE